MSKKVMLRKPIEKDGQSISELELKFDDLKGNDLVHAERQARMRGDISPDPLFSSEGLAVIAARVSGQIPEDILGLAAPDFLLVTNMVKNFLYDWASPMNMQSETSEKPS